MLFDGQNPRSLQFQLERLRINLKNLPSSTGSSRPERIVDEVSARLRRSDPAELEEITDGSREERRSCWAPCTPGCGTCPT